MRKRLLVVLFILSLLTDPAFSSCGVGVCTVNTEQEIQGWQDGLVTRADLRYENYSTDQPRFGTRAVSVGQIRRHHDEISTLNQNIWLRADVATSRNWGFSIQTPFIAERNHAHVHNHRGTQYLDTWNLGGLGDIRVLGRWQDDLDPKSRSFTGAKFGFKLPTGSTSEKNGLGLEAERTLQPGTGSLDVILGGYFNQAVGNGNGWFASVMVQQPLLLRDNYQPGNALYVDLGYRKKIDNRWSAFLQGNFLLQGQDQGANAEPQTGGTYFSLTPGLQYNFSKDVQMYCFVSVPVYQAVNDVQLTKGYAVTAGFNIRI